MAISGQGEPYKIWSNKRLFFSLPGLKKGNPLLGVKGLSPSVSWVTSLHQDLLNAGTCPTTRSCCKLRSTWTQRYRHPWKWVARHGRKEVEVRSGVPFHHTGLDPAAQEVSAGLLQDPKLSCWKREWMSSAVVWVLPWDLQVIADLLHSCLKGKTLPVADRAWAQSWKRGPPLCGVPDAVVCSMQKV